MTVLQFAVFKHAQSHLFCTMSESMNLNSLRHDLKSDYFDQTQGDPKPISYTRIEKSERLVYEVFKFNSVTVVILFDLWSI